MKKESKVEIEKTAQVEDENGQLHNVTVRRKSVRFQYADGTWSNWAPDTRSFMLGREDLRPADSEWFQPSSSGLRIRLPAAD